MATGGLPAPASARAARVHLISPERTPSLLQSRTRSRSMARRLHTPYNKTPQSRRIHGKTSRLSRTPGARSVASRNLTQSLGKLINKTWHAYHVSPLFSYDKEAASLRKYSRHLSSHLQAEAQKGAAVLVEESIASKYAIFKSLPELFPDSAIPALELSLYASKAQATAANGSPGWMAVFCPSSTPVAAGNGQFTSMPLLLVKGAAATTQHIIRWIEVQFDCCLTKLTFNPMALSWMVSMWADSLPDKKKSGGDKKCGVELVYHTSKSISGLSKITMTIDASDAKTLWESIHDQSSDEATEEEVSSFMRSLEEHFLSCFKVQLSALHLHTIGTAAAYVGSEGRVKMLSLGEAQGVIQHLVELAEERTVQNM